MNENPYLAIEHGGPGTIGWRVHHYAELGSTQEVAGQLAHDGAANGTVVVPFTVTLIKPGKTDYEYVLRLVK